MTKESEFVYLYPNDDGKRQRAWVTGSEERGKSACERAIKVLEARPWVISTKETVINSRDDQQGVDIFIKVDGRLKSILGMWKGKLPVAVQVKSNEHSIKEFKNEHRERIFNLETKQHTFILDGQDALDVITADLVGQLIVLGYLTGTITETDLLFYLEGELNDAEAVARYKENRDLIIDSKWYGPVIENAGEV